MAEDPKIVLDGPPWAPVDVEVSPDGPPWPPHDVPIQLDEGPWSPIDVPLYPDPPPWDAFQVATAPDGPPWPPHDVPTYPDAPPWDPIDVQSDPDPAPWDPVDVPVALDGPPADPVDVQTTPDGPPWAPTDPSIIPDDPPWQPVDVPVTPDGPGPLSDVIPVPEHDTPPPYVPPPGRSPGELVDSLRQYDAQLATFLEKVGQYVPFVSVAGKGAFDPLVLADWMRNYKEAVGYSGMTKFIGEQTALYAMNPTVARAFDPTYFLKLLVPGLTGMFNTTLDSIGGVMEEIVRAEDDVKVMVAQMSPPVGARDNVYDPTLTSVEHQDFTVDEMVDARTQEVPRLTPYLSEDRETGVARFDASKYFESRDSFGGSKVRGTTKSTLRAGGGQNVGSSKLARSAATHGIIRATVPGEGIPLPGGTVSYGGVVLSETTVPWRVDDDDVRLPLCFTDLRKDPASDSYRHIFFQPMNLVVAESLSPQYNESQAFGRTDANVGYVGTTRTYSISFEVHAFAPEDLRPMYEKKAWLTSMVYPTYGADSLMRSGPVCRVRVGDLASTVEGGVPGVIRNLSFDFSERLWELKKGMKVPMSFGVQVDYTVLHDGPVGILDGMFGVLSLPAGPSTNMADPPSQQSLDSGPPNEARLATGRWGRFGEPTRKG